jgi:hypothetical protein
MEISNSLFSLLSVLNLILLGLAIAVPVWIIVKLRAIGKDIKEIKTKIDINS